MSSQSTPQSCHHPARDIAIVALASGVVSLSAAVVTMALDASALEVLTSSGAAFIAALTAGLNVLQHLRHSA
ncbi:hypothetical protein [Streptomyces sp. C8S0]|uniref:hypothetical protein n=1 Tax=Streptomyces sp. C8S0 TaxID=2585716 RepID=UPI00125D8A9B|nr:hypothetical protein [Streptomyces sp. C8S0]